MDGSEDRMIPAVFRNTSMAHRGSSGQRISRAETKLTEGQGGETAETTRTGYYYQDGAVLYTRDADGRRSSMNLLGTSANIIATSRGTGDSESWYLYNKDIRESTTSLTAADGSAAATYEYDDFGGTTVTSGADLDNEICYTGQIYDRSTGLYYYNARYYDPKNARFLTQDTYRGDATQPDTLHLYAYCKNNPINYVDPTGHIAVDAAIALLVAAAAITVATLYYMTTKTFKSSWSYYCSYVGNGYGDLGGQFYNDFGTAKKWKLATILAVTTAVKKYNKVAKAEANIRSKSKAKKDIITQHGMREVGAMIS